MCGYFYIYQVYTDNKFMQREGGSEKTDDQTDRDRQTKRQRKAKQEKDRQ